jgi:drug/metabolite transporter (DMT)-like permease
MFALIVLIDVGTEKVTATTYIAAAVVVLNVALFRWKRRALKRRADK